MVFLDFYLSYRSQDQVRYVPLSKDYKLKPILDGTNRPIKTQIDNLLYHIIIVCDSAEPGGFTVCFGLLYVCFHPVKCLLSLMFKIIIYLKQLTLQTTFRQTDILTRIVVTKV